MLKKIALLEQAVLTVLKGGKIPLESPVYPEMHLLSSRLFAALFTSEEPQCHVAFPEYKDVDRKFMGNTRYHPTNVGAFVDQAEKIRTIAMSKAKPVIPLEILGMNQEKREAWRHSPDFKTHLNFGGALLHGDFESVWQALSVMRQRLENPDVCYLSPLIIQNKGHIWDGILFDTHAQDWPKRKAQLQRLNIVYSAGEPETVNLMAQLRFGKKIDPAGLTFALSSYDGAPDSDYAFTTTDSIKFGQTESAHKLSGSKGKFRKTIDLTGPFPSPPEKSFTFSANVVWEKAQAFYEFLKASGPDAIHSHIATRHGYKKPDAVNILFHDGGLGFCLETADGLRRIDLITEDLFPNTFHQMNEMRMFPGVEYAYLKRTDGLELTMQRLFQRVDEIIAADPRFKREDLRAYDTSVFVTGRLDRMMDEARRGEAFDPVYLGLKSSFAVQKLEVSEKPRFASAKHGVPETENYLIVPNSTLTRAETPDWHLNGPNVISFRGLRQAMGLQDQPVIAPEIKPLGKRKLISMGVLGTPEALVATKPSKNLEQVKSLLRHEFGIKTRMGADYWRAYKEDPAAVLRYAAAEVASNPAFNAGVRRLLDTSNVFYFGPMDRALNDREKNKVFLALEKALVRNQVFNPIHIVADRSAAAEVIAWLEHLQMAGFVSQKTENLLHIVDEKDPEAIAILDKNIKKSKEILTDEERDLRIRQIAAANKISQIVRANHPASTPVERQFTSDKQTENHQSLVMAAYLSASNCSATHVKNVKRLAYLSAVNGFDLKIGGGNDGLMKAAADAFLDGKKELETKGYNFPNQLILIQCADTEAIEMLYDGVGGITRCHPNIDSRMLDIMTYDVGVWDRAGMGGSEEGKTDLDARGDGIIDKKRPLILINPRIDSPNGPVGLYDPIKAMYSPKYLAQMGLTEAMTPEGAIDKACAYRREILQRPQQSIHLADMRNSLRDYMQRSLSEEMSVVANPALSRKRFRPPYDIYLGQEGDLPSAARPVKISLGLPSIRAA